MKSGLGLIGKAAEELMGKWLEFILVRPIFLAGLSFVPGKRSRKTIR